MTFIESICNALIEMNLAKSGNDFSVTWLGREQAYVRTLKGKNKSPSAEVIISLFKKLKVTGEQLQKSENASDQANGLKVMILADQCIKELFGPSFKLIQDENIDLIGNFAKKAGLKSMSETTVSPQEKQFAELIVRECGNFTDKNTRKLMFKHLGIDYEL